MKITTEWLESVGCWTETSNVDPSVMFARDVFGRWIATKSYGEWKFVIPAFKPRFRVKAISEGKQP